MDQQRENSGAGLAQAERKGQMAAKHILRRLLPGASPSQRVQLNDEFLRARSTHQSD